MIKLLLSISIFVGFLSLNAQVRTHEEFSESANFNSHFLFSEKYNNQNAFHNENIMEKERMKLDFNRSETILDSAIYYQYSSETDSVQIIKELFQFDENTETNLFYAWHNNQWVDSAKAIYTYNEFDLFIMLEEFLWDAMQSSWKNNRLTTATYDEDNNYDVSTYLIWNDELDRWDKNIKEDRDYDENGNVLAHYQWVGNDANEWEYSQKIINTYNSDGSLHDFYAALWNTDLDEWDNYLKEEFIYNESGQIDYKLQYSGMLGDWQQSFKTDYYYSNSGEADSLVTFQMVNEEWALFSKVEYEYDENDNLLVELELKWLNNNWVNFYKYNYAYDENDNQILSQVSYWNTTDNLWIFLYKSENTYNNMNDPTMRSSYNWSNELDNWVGSYKYEFIYIDDERMNFIINYKWDEVNIDWVADEKIFYYRSEVVGIEEIPESNIALYPNPVSNNLHIEKQNAEKMDVTILSLTGQKLKQFNIQNNLGLINIEDLPNGIYIIQFQSNAINEAKKFIKN